MLAYAVAVLGLNLLLGYSGQISLGHGAFFALGAYVDGDPDRQARLAAPARRSRPRRASASPRASLVGIPALRLRGLYLALVTLGLAVAMPQVIKRFEGLTGGTQGLSVPQPHGARRARASSPTTSSSTC